jgi:hypothetical protein
VIETSCFFGIIALTKTFWSFHLVLRALYAAYRPQPSDWVDDNA